MNLATEETRNLIGRRVELKFDDSRVTAFGTLRGLPKDGSVTLLTRNESGYHDVIFKGVVSVSWAPYSCSSCGDKVDVIHDTICADCYRREAERRRAKGPVVTPCDNCGQKPAFRNPKGSDNTKLLCAQCHAKKGDLPKDYSIITKSFPAAECIGSDIDSPKHVWKKIKSGRWRCEGFGCNADRFTPPRW